MIIFNVLGEFYGYCGEASRCECSKRVFLLSVSVIVLHDGGIHGPHETTQVR